MPPAKALDLITEWSSKLDDNWQDRDWLSEAAGRIANYNLFVAMGIAKSHRVSDSTYITHYKQARKSDNVGDSENYAKEKSLDAREEYENLRYTYKAVESMVTTIQSRIRQMDDEKYKLGDQV